MGVGADHTILWRRLDGPGHEAARVFARDERWHLVGTAVFAHEGEPCRLDYAVVCDTRWHTLSGRVDGWIGSRTVALEITVDTAHRWQVNGVHAPAADGCVDLDLNFTPSTNMLPIRRLGLAPGQDALVRAAWLRFPALTLERLDQLYFRVDATTYRYESAADAYAAEFRVNEAGIVTLYPDGWQAEPGP
jgi:hypothetical protein